MWGNMKLWKAIDSIGSRRHSWLNWVFQPQEVIGSDWHGCKASFTTYPNQSNIATNPSTSMNWSIRLEKPSSLNISEADVLPKLSLDLISLTLNCMAILQINTWVFNSLGEIRRKVSFLELPKSNKAVILWIFNRCQHENKLLMCWRGNVTCLLVAYGTLGVL